MNLDEVLTQQAERLSAHIKKNRITVEEMGNEIKIVDPKKGKTIYAARYQNVLNSKSTTFN